MANENCLEGLWCPNCGSDGPFEIHVKAWVKVYDDGTGAYSDVAWLDSDNIVCCCCHHGAIVADFREPEARLPKGGIHRPELAGSDKPEHQLWLWNFLGTDESCGRQGRIKDECCPICTKKALVEWRADKAEQRESCLNGCELPCVKLT